MAHVEPMDIDCMESDYENKENSIIRSNALPKIPSTEKGYEDLDVSELNMKLRYSITPASSPMSRSYTANCKDNKNIEDKSMSLNTSDLTSSLNSTLTNSDINKSSKVYPLQSLPTDNLNDTNRNVLFPKSLAAEDNNITITVSDNIDDNFSIPSTSSSIPHTPEATTPTKEVPKDGGSPIMRGLRSVLSMFKPQSPQPSHELSSQADSLLQANSTITDESELTPVQISTPLNKTNRVSPIRTSPQKEIVIFNDDLEKELQWNDDSTIFFKEEKIPKHKLLLQGTIALNLESKILNKTKEEVNKTLEYMDISYNDTVDNDKTMTDVETKPCAVFEAGGLESDGEFVDCETTYTKQEIESLLRSKENISMHNSKQHVSMNAEVTTSHLTKEVSSLNSMSSIELGAGPSEDLANSAPSAKISEINCLDSTTVLQETHSLTYSKDSSLCETDLTVNSDILDSIVNNYSASNIEASKINSMEDNDGPNVTNTIQCTENQITDKKNVSYDIEIKNMSECKENSIDEINNSKIFIPMKESDIESREVNNIKCNNTGPLYILEEDAKSNEVVCNNSFTRDVDPILSQVDNQNTNDTIDKDTVKSVKSDAIDFNMKNKVVEEGVIMEVTDYLKEASNNSSESLKINLDDKKSGDKCKEILSEENNTIRNKEHIESYAVNNSSNVENKLHNTETTLPESELKIQMPVDIPLPTDDFDKDIDTYEVNNLCENITYEFNEVIQRSIINTNKGLDTLSNEMPNSSEKSSDHTMNCNKTFDTDNSFEIIEKDQVNVSHLPQGNENDQKVIEPIHKNRVDNEIGEEIVTINKSLQPTREISRNKFSLKCDTISNFENMDERSTEEQVISNPFETKNKLQQSPPLSPSASNRGYNIDFEHIDNPFATKTKIRLSPTPEIPDQIFVPTDVNNTRKVSAKMNKSNKRKSYPVRKPLNSKHSTLNATFDGIIEKDCKSKCNEKSDTTIINIKKDLSFIADASTLPKTANFEPDVNIENKTINNKEDDLLVSKRADLSSTQDIAKNVQPAELSLTQDISKIVEPADVTFVQDITENVELADVSFAQGNSKNVEPADVSPAQDIDKNVEPANLSLAQDITKNEEPADLSPAQDIIKNLEPADLSFPSSITKNEEPADLSPAQDITKNVEPADLSPARDLTKNVFNCPEINDLSFCSFSDKDKTMPSDLMMPADDIIDKEERLKLNTDVLKSNNSEFINDQQMLKIGNETSVSRDSKNSDTKEVNTEDEDTATFNETMEFIENDKENAGNVKDLLEFEVSHAALDTENVDNGEMFIDAEAFEFLLNQNQSNIIADSGKESLFLKFDPLFTKRVSSDGLIAALKRVQNNQSTPKKITKLELEAACEMPGPSQKETLDDVTDDASIQALTKPMMVVNPAISSIVSPRKLGTPKVNRQSLTFTSPAMAVIDKLLSLSGSSLLNDQNTPASSPVRQHNETDIAITQLREMLADKDIHVHNLRSESKELKDRLSSLEAQVSTLEAESSERLKKVNDLNERLLEKTKINKSMANVVEEYERTIASLITQIEQEKKNNAAERLMLISERDEQTAHLASMEVSFNDLHSKYEKSKQLIYSMKANEEMYKKSIHEFEESLAKMQNNYELLKQHATSKLNHANLELEKFNRAHEAEVLKLNAMIKRKELHITSLEETLAQKTKANEELTAICDELINKVG